MLTFAFASSQTTLRLRSNVAPVPLPFMLPRRILTGLSVVMMPVTSL
jgi:hypothetical protein